LKSGFFSLPQTDLETALLAGRPHRGMEGRHKLQISITGRSSGDARRQLIDVTAANLAAFAAGQPHNVVN
jgi:hypothetical protein